MNKMSMKTNSLSHAIMFPQSSCCQIHYNFLLLLVLPVDGIDGAVSIADTVAATLLGWKDTFEYHFAMSSGKTANLIKADALSKAFFMNSSFG